jgi:ABC-type dipeptide/oligopeptide/nickel transport system permease subunit
MKSLLISLATFFTGLWGGSFVLSKVVNTWMAFPAFITFIIIIVVGIMGIVVSLAEILTGREKVKK